MSAPPPEDRRRLLRATDALLEQIEGLRLRDLAIIPPELQTRIAEVASEIGVAIPARTPRALADAHDQVFRLQRLLLRGGGGPRVRRGLSTVAPRTDLPLLSLPEQDGFESRAAWLEQVRLVVQRAHDRVRYLEAQVGAAERRSGPGAEALANRRRAEAEDAQQNWRELAQQAEQIAGRPLALDPLPGLPATGQLRLGDVDIDLDSGQVHRGGQPVRLTSRERACLVALAANRGRVLTREALQHLVCGDEPTLGVRSKVLDVHLSHLRAKLGGSGYFEAVAYIGFRGVGSPRPTSEEATSLQETEARRAARAAWARASSASPSGRPPASERRSGRRLRR